MPTLTFDCVADSATRTISFEAENLVLAGLTGRDQTAVQHHVDELQELGIAPPSTIPIFYRTGVELVTQADRLQVLGPHTSGEVEYVLLVTEDSIWFTVGSDQTDRKAEAIDIALSKQLAGKVIARTAWNLAEYAGRWDSLMMRSWATIEGERVLYQETALANVLDPDDLIGRYTSGGTLAPGTVMMSGTPAAIGGIRPGTRFEIELADEAAGRNITHAYDIDVLPVIA